ncbi:MAG TPA: ABC transporter substrate-binding protein [Rhodocyclaceae bacterium]|nr:ABC transporter substrate-binding protein [Rhodocyclaceae bacterium]
MLCRGFVIAALSVICHAAYAGHLEDVRANKVLRVCIWPEYSSVSYRQPGTGRVSGVNVDLARELARDLGVKVMFVESSFAKFPDHLALNRCDLAVSSVGLASVRADKLRFIRPHIRGGVCAVVSRENARIKDWGDLDKKGVVVEVTKGSLAEAVARESVKAASIQAVDGIAELGQDVEAHRADALFVECQEAQQMQEGSQWARQLVAPVGSIPRALSYAWAMVADDNHWYARIEYFMSEVRRDGRLRTAARRYGVEALAVLD